MTERIVCVGDSITRGQVSVDYVELLRGRFRDRPYAFVNHGVNYDLAYNVSRRLDRIVAEDPHHVIVLVGTNDANATLGEANRRLLTLIRRLPVRPSAQWYADNLAAILQGLERRTYARVAVLSLPVIGEDLESVPLRRAGEYSAIAQEVAAAHNADYLPLHERQVEDLRTSGHRPGTRYRPGMMLSSTASTQHFVLRRSLDEIAERRGLRLTTDTVHQNSRGAGMIADLIEQHLMVRSGHA
ncbi:GDSL-type esterase/lipase family protein [Nonomuraea sp. NPDC000554]|uniref:SGNH/GDSL hydrolase family protein n=1 Tax=Nonomuraea sp. NPDC000554 TaxID=3154259 RepID=UPI003333399F